MCALTPFGQTGPWRDYASSDLLHMAAGGEMASSGYDGGDAPNAPPIAPGGGNAWHMGCHFAYVAIMAALIYRTVAGQGQYIDASIHEACALTTEAAIANYIYRGEVLRRQTGRHHASGPTPRTQFRAKDGAYVCALVAGRLNPKYVRDLAELLDTNGMAGDLKDPKYQDPAVIAANTSHIIDDLVANFIASLPAEEVYHAAQEVASPGARCEPRRLSSTTPTCMIAASGKRWSTRSSAAASSIQAKRPSTTALHGGSPDGRR